MRREPPRERSCTSSGCPYVSLTIGHRIAPALDDEPTVTGELEQLGAIPFCTRGQLHASEGLPGHDAGEMVMTFSFRNTATAVCRLYGFPRLRFVDAHGHAMRIAAVDEGASIVRREGIDASVALDPQQSASFGISWTRCAADTAARVGIRLRGVARRFVLPVGSSGQRLDPCHGRLKVGNLTGMP
jgi:hypothetical protein